MLSVEKPEMYEKEFECPFCYKRFTTKKYLRSHIKTIHESSRVFVCPLCGKQLAREKGLQQHLRTIHEGKWSVYCSICGKGFINQCRLKKHTRSVHERSKRFHCSVCGKLFPTESSRKQHFAAAHRTEGVPNPEHDDDENSDEMESSSEHSSCASGTNEDLILESPDSSSLHDSSSPIGSTRIGNNKPDNSGTSQFLNLNGTSNPLLSNLLFKSDAFKSIADLIGASNNRHNQNKNEEETSNELFQNREEASSSNKILIANVLDQFLLNHTKSNSYETNPCKNDDSNEQPVVENIKSKNEVFSCIICRESHNSSVALFQHIMLKHSTADTHSAINMEKLFVNLTNQQPLQERVNIPVNDQPEWLKSLENQNNTFDTIKGQALLKMMNGCWPNTHAPFLKQQRRSESNKDVENSSEEEPLSYTAARLFQHIHKRIGTSEMLIPNNTSHLPFSIANLAFPGSDFNHNNLASLKMIDKFARPNLMNTNFNTIKNPILSSLNSGFCCQTCGLRFPDRLSLRQHKSAEHKSSGPRYNCSHCDKSFATKEYQKLHEATVHEGTKAFTCVTCGKNFSVQQALRKHVIIQHEGGKPYRCSLCKMCFRSRANMTQHRMLHHQSPSGPIGVPYHPPNSSYSHQELSRSNNNHSSQEISFEEQLNQSVKKIQNSLAVLNNCYNDSEEKNEHKNHLNFMTDRLLTDSNVYRIEESNRQISRDSTSGNYTESSRSSSSSCNEFSKSVSLFRDSEKVAPTSLLVASLIDSKNSLV